MLKIKDNVALKELENGECETFKDFNAYKKAMREI